MVRARPTLAALCGLLVITASAAAPAAARSPDPVIRVLVLDNRRSVTVRDHRAGGKEIVLETRGAGGLTADRRPVGDVWRMRGGGIVSADQFRVRGGLEVRRVPDGLQVINEVELEDYVAGTLGGEIYSSWDPEALKAQAVAARSYALHQRARNGTEPYHVGAGTGHQVYGGVDVETPAVVAAVSATRGEYLAYQRRPILAVYHSASGGRTASSQEVWGESLPYLVSVKVEGEEESPDTYWRAAISGTKRGRALVSLGIQIGSVRALRVVDRSRSGRALRVQIRGDTGSHMLEARALRVALGETVIRSTLFEIRVADGKFVFAGSGYGHGVGMSQWGAQGMALSGSSYREILRTFYPGTSLVRGRAQ
jgi:stage II sporulation protein D